ncbi:NAD-dependent epimerase/dehydratase family protein [Paenibacillus sp. RC67]|uniref:NAD-dependent epimerase/dehydratase family protein n=1 Tax=Paenibacillus sp. RC67 TaxID=3039392 RepID=UPI0024ADFDAF|nr:NAD-dependent epimerase/dehydratase family protein [Paenibacillus sp. RC67]
MKAVVTGGAGFIGSHLVEALVDQNHEVHVIDNLSTGQLSHVHPSAYLHIENIYRKESSAIIEKVKPDIVFHLAAQVDVQRSIQDPNEDADINIGGTIRLLSACKEASVRKIIFSSSCAVYGDVSQQKIQESMAVNPISYYGLSKSAGESYIRLFRQLYGLEYTILRYSNVYGPRQTAKGEGGVIAIFMNKLKQDLSLFVHGDGEQTRDFIYVKDIVNANLAAISSGADQLVNVSTGSATSVNQLVSTLQQVHDKPIEINHGPERSGDIKHSCLDNKKAESVLGWTPSTGLFQGLVDTYQYYVAN